MEYREYEKRASLNEKRAIYSLNLAIKSYDPELVFEPSLSETGLPF